MVSLLAEIVPVFGAIGASTITATEKSIISVLCDESTIDLPCNLIPTFNDSDCVILARDCVYFLA